MRIRLSKAAARDVDEAWEHTAERWSPEQADNLLETFEAKFRLLARYPGAGRRRDELAPGVRSLVASGFVILYQIHEEVLEVVRLVHGSRDLEGLLTEDDAPNGPRQISSTVESEAIATASSR